MGLVASLTCHLEYSSECRKCATTTQFVKGTFCKDASSTIITRVLHFIVGELEIPVPISRHSSFAELLFAARPSRCAIEHCATAYERIKILNVHKCNVPSVAGSRGQIMKNTDSIRQLDEADACVILAVQTVSFHLGN